MSLTLAEVERILKALGVPFSKAEHHVWGYVQFDGAKSLFVHYSYIDEGPAGDRATQSFVQSLGLSRAEFDLLHGGRMSAAEYFQIVSAKLADPGRI